MDMNILFAVAASEVLSVKTPSAASDAGGKSLSGSAAPFTAALQTATKNAPAVLPEALEDSQDAIISETLALAAMQTAVVVMQVQQQVAEQTVEESAAPEKTPEPLLKAQQVKVPEIIDSLTSKANAIQTAIANIKSAVAEGVPAEKKPLEPSSAKTPVSESGATAMKDLKTLFGDKLEETQAAFPREAQPFRPQVNNPNNLQQDIPQNIPQNAQQDTLQILHQNTPSIRQQTAQPVETAADAVEGLTGVLAEQVVKAPAAKETGTEEKTAKTDDQARAHHLDIKPVQTVAKPEQPQATTATNDDAFEQMVTPKPEKTDIGIPVQPDSGKAMKVESEPLTAKAKDTPAAPVELNVANMTREVQPQKIQFAEQPVAPNDIQEIVDNLVEQAKLTQKPGVSEMVIRLRPDHLGEMTVKITAEAGGAITASFHSNNPEVRNLIQESLPAIKQELSNSGFKVNDVGVYAGLGDFQSFAQQQQHGGQFTQQTGGNRNKLSADDLKLLDELQAVDGNLSTEGGVDYKV